MRHFSLAPEARFELAANWLTANCSTTELPRIIFTAYTQRITGDDYRIYRRFSQSLDSLNGLGPLIGKNTYLTNTLEAVELIGVRGYNLT